MIKTDSNPRNLYILTETFPYGTGEVFLDNEIRIIAQYFPKIILLPRKRSNNLREIPGNVSLDERLVFNPKEISLAIIKSFFGLRYLKWFLKGYDRKFSLFRSYRYFLGLISEGRLVASKLEEVDKKDTVFYAYWLKHGAIGLTFLNGKAKKIARGHGSDIYSLTYSHSLHHRLGMYLDKILPVSIFGMKCLTNTYQIEAQKIEVNRLGTQILVKNQEKNKDKVIIVSCSNCIPLKRVDMILSAVQLYSSNNKNLDIEYVHFGDGPELSKIKSLSLKNPNNLKTSFLGRVPNLEVQSFYANNKVSCFINFSTSEGIPVSIMEALSYGIPIVASNVGGTREVVSQDVGILISTESSLEDIAKHIELLINNPQETWSPENCNRFWEKNFSAEHNYEKLANLILSL